MIGERVKRGSFSIYELIGKAETKMIPPSFEELIVSLEASLWEGQVLTSMDIDDMEFIGFTKKLINDMLEYAKKAE